MLDINNSDLYIEDDLRLLNYVNDTGLYFNCFIYELDWEVFMEAMENLDYFLNKMKECCNYNEKEWDFFDKELIELKNKYGCNILSYLMSFLEEDKNLNFIDKHYIYTSCFCAMHNGKDYCDCKE